MEDIQPIGTYGVVKDHDVNKSLNGLYSGSRYAAADLYKRYAEIVKADGRSPGHPTAYGQVLARYGLNRVKMTVDKRQVSAWVVR